MRGCCKVGANAAAGTEDAGESAKKHLQAGVEEATEAVGSADVLSMVKAWNAVFSSKAGSEKCTHDAGAAATFGAVGASGTGGVAQEAGEGVLKAE